MDKPIERAEHEEFKRRLEEWNKRQDKRISMLEETVKDLKTMSLSIERLSTIMESMLIEQKTQGERLCNLEKRDGEMWRKVVGYAITAIVGIVIGYIFNLIGMN